MSENHSFLFCVFIAALIMLSGCSTKRLDDLDASVGELRRIQADHTAALDEIRADLRMLAGKVEQIERQTMGKTKELERSLQRLGTRVPPPPGVPEDLLTQDEEAIAAIAGPAAEMYRQALGFLRGGDIEESRKLFARFVDQNPGTAFTDNALFWLGIACTKLGQYDRAVVAFSEVFQKYPAEDMVPAALYYLGESFVKAGTPKDAALSWQKLVDEHPKSVYAARARTRLAEYKKPVRAPAAPARKR